MTLKFDPNYKSWKDKFDTELVYTRKDMADHDTALRKQLRVNRVIQSFTGRVGPNESIAMQILAIHETPEGTLVIVK